MFRQGVQYLRANRLLKLRRRTRFVRARFDPGLRGFALAALLEAVDEFAEPTTKDPAGTGTAETDATVRLVFGRFIFRYAGAERRFSVSYDPPAASGPFRIVPYNVRCPRCNGYGRTRIEEFCNTFPRKRTSTAVNRMSAKGHSGHLSRRCADTEIDFTLSQSASTYGTFFPRPTYCFEPSVGNGSWSNEMAKKSSADQPISREKLAALLNEDLSREYQAIIAYVVYSQAKRRAVYEHRRPIGTHAQQELEHALIISRQIDYLGKMPTKKLRNPFGPRRTPRKCFGSILKTRMKPSATTVNGFGNAKRWVNLRWRSKFSRFYPRARPSNRSCDCTRSRSAQP